MPLILIARLVTSLFSWLFIAAIAYFLWTWYRGYNVIDTLGVIHFARQDWRLWTGLAFLVWSIGGGSLLIKPFLAKRDRDPLPKTRRNGHLIPGSDGAELYVEIAGPDDAPTVILTHGWGLDTTIWGYTKRDLVRHFRVITWDLPTMGRSKAPLHAVSLESFARNLAAVMRHAGSGRVVLVSHSIGGMTTQTLARDEPAFFKTHVAGVVLLNTSYHNPLKTMFMSNVALALRFPVLEPQFFITMALWPLAWLSAWKSYLDGSAHIANRLGFGPDVTHSQLEHTTLLSIRNSQAGQAKGNLSMFRWDADGALAITGVPALVIAGHNDIVTKPQASRHIVSVTPGAELLVVDRANHMGFLEKAEIYNDALTAFILNCNTDINGDRSGLPSSVA